MILPVFFVGSALFYAAVNYAFDKVMEDGQTNRFENYNQGRDGGSKSSHGEYEYGLGKLDEGNNGIIV